MRPLVALPAWAARALLGSAFPCVRWGITQPDRIVGGRAGLKVSCGPIEGLHHVDLQWSLLGSPQLPCLSSGHVQTEVQLFSKPEGDTP